VWERKGTRLKLVIMGKKKQLSGAQKRKKKKEREEAAKDAERLKLGPTTLWSGLVVHQKDVFVSHVISKLNGTDRYFFSYVNTESLDVLKYAGVDVSKLCVNVHECSSISTLEWAWNHSRWGEEDEEGNVVDQPWFCKGAAGTNKLELLKWIREKKKCEWSAGTINRAAEHGNLEMVKYCVANECPIGTGACANAAENGHLACLKYLHEEVKAPWDYWSVYHAHKNNQTECVQYLLGNNCPLPRGWRYEHGVLHAQQESSSSSSSSSSS